jgi:hypothetical protein
MKRIVISNVGVILQGGVQIEVAVGFDYGPPRTART